MTDPADLIDGVHDFASFLAFVRALMDDWNDSVRQERASPSNPSGPAADGWENITIGDFLDGALAWAESTRMGETQGLPPGPSWQAFAAFLLRGKIHE